MSKTVRELIEDLQKLPQDHTVILSRDGEGNGYSPYSGDWSTGIYTPYSTYHGEYSSYVYDEETGEESEAPKELHNAIVLWPLN